MIRGKDDVRMEPMADPRLERWIRPAPWDPEDELAHLRDLPPERLVEMQREMSELCTALALSGRSMPEIEALREPMSGPALAWWRELVRRGRQDRGGQRP